MPVRIAIALAVLLALVLPPATVAGQDFDPSSSTFVLRGMAARKNSGTPGGAAWGSVEFDASGLVTGGNITRIDGTTGTFLPTPISTLTVTGRALDGLFDTGSNPTSLNLAGVAATDDLLFLSTETPLSPDFPGLLVGVRQTGTFTLSDLGGTTWRFKALAVQVPAFSGPVDDGGWAFGSLTLAANASVTTGSTIAYPDGSSGAVTNGSFTISAAGAVTGSFDATVLGTCPGVGTVQVDGVMTPDKTLIAAVITLTCDVTVGSGMVIFQRDPDPTTYSSADLAGTYDFIGIEQHSDNDNVGTWARGNISFDGSGVVSAGTLFDADGGTTEPTGSVEISTDGFLCSGDTPCEGVLTASSPVELHGTMTADKDIVLGVWSRTVGGIPRTALFAWVKRPPPPTIAFSASDYYVLEANTAATITVERSGDTTTQVTVDYATAVATTGVPATAGADYTAISAGTLTFAAGETSKTFAVTILDDTELEQTERVKLVLGNPGGGATLGSLFEAHLRIQNDDSVVQFNAGAISVPESAGTTPIAVSRTGYTASPASVTYTITAGAAASGAAATAAATGALSFPAGAAGASILLTVAQDTLANGAETMTIALSDPVGDIAIGAIPSTVVTIVDDDVAGTVAFSASTYTVTEGGPAAVITVVRSGGSASGVTVQYATSNGTATAPADYTASTGTLTFGAGQTSRTFTVPILDDAALEPRETVNLTLSMPTGGAVLGTAAAVLRIVDNDSLVQFSAAGYTRGESAGGTSIAVTRTGYRGTPATVTYTIANTSSATAGLDYTAPATGILSFPAGVGSVPLPLTILQDTLAEGAETIDIILGAPTGAMQLGTNESAVLTISDDDAAGTLAFSASTYTGIEGGPAVVVTVVRSGGAASGVTVRYATSNGTASAGADYTGRTGTLTFGAGQMSRTFTVPILDDAAVEGVEFLTLMLRNAAGGASLGAQSTAELRILDNESTVQFSAAAYTRAEGAGATSINVIRSGYRGNPATVSYMIANSTATIGLDYSAAASGVLSFPAGVASVPLPMTILQDTLAEGSETIQLVLSGPTGNMQLGTNAGAVVTLTDDDAAGTLAFSAATYTAVEGTPAAVITVVRSGGAASGVTVRYATSNGTATAGGDYIATSGTLSFGAGQMSRTFTVTILNDIAVEGTQRVNLTLSNATGGASLAEPFTAALRIGDDDSIVRFEAAAHTRAESAGATAISVVRTGSLIRPATVRYTVTGATASAGLDYTATASATLTFPAGVGSRPVPITILQDTLAEGAETLGIVLSDPTGGMRLGATSSTVLTIADDDIAGSIAFSSSTYAAAEGGPAAVITVVRTGGDAGGVTVQYATSDGTATGGIDYAATSGTLTFAAGDSTATFTVPILEDVAGEAGETVRLTLSSPTGGASVGTPATALLTIADNEPVVQFTGRWVGSRFEVARTGPTNVTVTVEYASIDGTAVAGVDYEPLAGTLTFAPGITTRLIPIRIISDTVAEGDETFTLFLRNPVGARLGDYRSHVMVIKDND